MKMFKFLAASAAAFLSLGLAGARAQFAGSTDASFNPDVSGTVNVIVLQTDGKILVGGTFTSISGAPIANLARLNPDGSLDTAFNPVSLNGPALAIAVQPADGAIIVGGGFTKVNGLPANHIARFAADGTFDIAFNGKAGANDAVHAIAVLRNGQIAIGGDFTMVEGQAIPFVAYLNGDGKVDAAKPPSAPNNSVLGMTLNMDGSGVVIVGKFTLFGGATLSNRIAALGPDAVFDPSFNPGTGANDTVSSIQTGPEGNYIISGVFSQFNDQIAGGVAFVEGDGFSDGGGLSYLPNSGVSATALIFAIPPGGIVPTESPKDTTVVSGGFDEKLAIGGSFNMLNSPVGSTVANHLAQFAMEGVPDPNFSASTGTDLPVLAMVYQSDNKLLAGGAFTTYNGEPHKGLVRIYGEQPVNVSVDFPKIYRNLAQAAEVTFARNAVDLTGDNLKLGYTVTTGLTAGVDYNGLSGTKKIKTGKGAGSVPIVGLLPSQAKGKVTITLLPGIGYTVGPQSTVSVKIKD